MSYSADNFKTTHKISNYFIIDFKKVTLNPEQLKTQL